MAEVGAIDLPEPKRRAKPLRPQLKDRPFQRIGHVKTMAGTLAATGVLLPPALTLRLLGRDGAGRVPMAWHRIVSRSLGVRSRLIGAPASGSVLYVSNHISWLDIPVLGAWLNGSFVAKAEVGEMGMVSLLADLQNTIYVEREQRRRSAEQAGAIEGRLRSGDNVILFPEGTSNDGVRVLPFKSTLFSVVEGEAAADIRIQPISLAYTHLNGLPLTRQRLMEIAWVGDMELGPHAMEFMRLGRIAARILCHEPVRRTDFPDRKALARHCHGVVSAGYRKLMRGEI
ncbi:1-acyl-sn-glycerol-3-phosphate acyltransferase [Sandaracinobacter sp. RS1-74]|uniref:lysophospholipid acyltransferase family protein n=1 Tax=Sandaracinobacteroides sayramensis TaxID=2913411 RepID=UPI001EDA288F|nr:lysophospholipid acyltransferase family protein [Sandaracinobacteroides sayramensis]MCG2840107.1 1-acyl-sn-glycerol-3-phosphate acyltransferase [Sandaracinobacteroides sayramensis]